MVGHFPLMINFKDLSNRSALPPRLPGTRSTSRRAVGPSCVPRYSAVCRDLPRRRRN